MVRMRVIAREKERKKARIERVAESKSKSKSTYIITMKLGCAIDVTVTRIEYGDYPVRPSGDTIMVAGIKRILHASHRACNRTCRCSKRGEEQ